MANRPPAPRLLSTDSLRLCLESALADSVERIDVVSAFVSVEGAQWLIDHLPDCTAQCRLLVRWKAEDLTSGFGTLAIFPTLEARGVRIYMNPSLHAKAFLLDRKLLFLGSANLTASGMAMGTVWPNIELSVGIDASDDDVAVIESMFQEAVAVTPELIAALQSWLDLQDPHPRRTIEFPPALRALVNIPALRLWVAELPWGPPLGQVGATESPASRHDTLLLQSSGAVGGASRLSSLRCYRWLVGQLVHAPDRQLYFGELSARLHDALLDDPAPYRSTVKQLLGNLLAWVAADVSSGITIDVPTHSQRVTLR